MIQTVESISTKEKIRLIKELEFKSTGSRELQETRIKHFQSKWEDNVPATNFDEDFYIFKKELERVLGSKATSPCAARIMNNWYAKSRR